jgi:Sulfotransferase family
VGIDVRRRTENRSGGTGLTATRDAEQVRDRRGWADTLAAAAGASLETLHDALSSASLYGAAAYRVLPRGGLSVPKRVWPVEERAVFVVGSPRSGTSFVARSIGAMPGFVDLGEVAPVKAAIPELSSASTEQAARRLRRRLETVRRLALVQGLRGVEQTPEMAFALAAALRAYPAGRGVHIIRDGRDVVCSLLERGWLRKDRSGGDDANQPYGAHPRFWVEPERVESFSEVSDARRAAWAWRRYVSAARRQSERVLEVRYEKLVSDSEGVAREIAAFLGVPAAPLERALAAAHADSAGRYERELSPEQLADVEREAGPLLAELGYL